MPGRIPLYFRFAFLLLPATLLALPHGSCALSHAGFQDKAQQADVLPVIPAEALDKSSLTLPSGLEGKQNLLLLSWARDQASQVESWTAVAQALQHTDFDFRVYRMLVSAPENALFRWWDNASLRAGETDPELLHWDVPLYTDETTLRRSLGLGTREESIVAVLVDRTGKVLWKALGPSTAASRASLLAASMSAR